MDVTIEPHIGHSITTGKEVRLNQYRIRVDGKHAGFVGFASGAPVLLHTRFSPIEITDIENQVAFLKKDLNAGKATCAPEVPPAMLTQKNDQDIDDLEDGD